MIDHEANFFHHPLEQGSLYCAGMSTTGGWVAALPVPASKPLYDPWPEQAREIAATHADRMPECECGACSKARDET